MAESVTSLLEKLNEDENSRLQAIRCLGDYGEKAVKAVPALVQKQNDISSLVTQEAIAAIRKVGEVGIPILLEIMRNPTADDFAEYADAFSDENEYRSHAAYCLGALGAVALPYLLEAMDDPKEEVRETAIEAIPCVGIAAELAVPKLEEVLRGSVLCKTAAISLAIIASHSAEAADSPAYRALIHAFATGDAPIRRAVISVVEFMGDKVQVVIPLLVRATGDPDPQVREIASDSLDRIRSA